MHKLYDTKNLMDTHQGDRQFMRHIAGLFIQHMPQMTSELKKAYLNKDWPNLYFYSHKMKASIDLFGIKDLNETIRDIEQQGKTGLPSDKLDGEVQSVEHIITQCVDQLQNEFVIADKE
jgi:HPt (histidine-containing phosphotransfer) domain-containing protein